MAKPDPYDVDDSSELDDLDEPEPCELCEMTADEDDVEMTTNQGILQVNVKKYIVPLCPTHDTDKPGSPLEGQE